MTRLTQDALGAIGVLLLALGVIAWVGVMELANRPPPTAPDGYVGARTPIERTTAERTADR